MRCLHVGDYPRKARVQTGCRICKSMGPVLGVGDGVVPHIHAFAPWVAPYLACAHWVAGKKVLPHEHNDDSIDRPGGAERGYLQQ